MHQHRWTPEEDFTVIREVLVHFVKGNGCDMDLFLKDLKTKVPAVPVGSIRMKIQNIKTMLEEKKIKNCLDVSPLENYSKQCMAILEAFIDAANKGTKEK